MRQELTSANSPCREQKLYPRTHILIHPLQTQIVHLYQSQQQFHPVRFEGHSPLLGIPPPPERLSAILSLPSTSSSVNCFTTRLSTELCSTPMNIFHFTKTLNFQRSQTQAVSHKESHLHSTSQAYGARYELQE